MNTLKIKEFLIVFLISIFTFAKILQATPLRQIPMTTTYKQGIYDISQFDGYLGKFKLITPDKPVTIITIDSNGMQELFTMLNSSKDEIITGPATKGDTLIVIGAGEIAASNRLIVVCRAILDTTIKLYSYSYIQKFSHYYFIMWLQCEKGSEI